MSKYSDALEDLILEAFFHIDTLDEAQTLDCYKIVVEAIYKAEKYDEINRVFIGEGYATDDDTTDKAKVFNVFDDMHDLVIENLLLKKGVKIIFKHIDLVKNGEDIPYSLGRYIGSEKDSFLSDSETDKIKAMLEVVENEK